MKSERAYGDSSTRSLFVDGRDGGTFTVRATTTTTFLLATENRLDEVRRRESYSKATHVHCRETRGRPSSLRVVVEWKVKSATLRELGNHGLIPEEPMR